MSERPLILLSNDDGIDAPYLPATASAVAEATGAEVVVVAPERERSAVSHSITLHKPLRAVDRGDGWFSVSGSPADCVYVAVNRLLERRPALVMSGINRGHNLGADVFYSGTVAAAAEGALRGITGISLSLAPGGAAALPTAARFAGQLAEATLQQLERHGAMAKTVLNVNMPVEPTEAFEWTRLGERVYHDVVEDRSDPRGRPYYWIGGGIAPTHNPPGTDCHAIDQGRISVTPLFFDLTDFARLSTPLDWDVAGFEMQPQAAAGPS